MSRGTITSLLGRIGVRLLVVNLLVLLVPVAGLEFARIHERQLLDSLERDMKNQATLTRALVENDFGHDISLADPRHTAILTDAARRTRTRIRILDEKGDTIVDSHEYGPPEGPEPPPPHMLPTREIGELSSDMRHRVAAEELWSAVPDRAEVRAALGGKPSSHTRVRDRKPGVFLFVSEPVRRAGAVVGVVYVVRSTQPVLVELYRIRSGLIRVLIVAFLFTALVTALLSLSISRPLGKLSRAAKRVAAGEPDVVIPVSGGGEIEELGQSFSAMKDKLAARMRYISDFAADVAHEFKSPLTSIRGAAELLGEGAADEPDARARFLRNIELDVARLDRLVSRLLELSRIEASSELMALVDLESLCVRAAERAMTPDQPIEVHYLAPARFLRAREADLEAAIFNLLDNAVRFSPPDVPVEITVTGGGPALCIAVTDKGSGISQANLPRIFDRFFTTDADRDGTGLGLAIVKSVIVAHGGTIDVTSVPGQGTRFTIVLPIRV